MAALLNSSSRFLAAQVDVTKLDQGIVQYKAADTEKKWLGFHWNDQAHNLGVWHNSKRHDWKQHSKYLYAPNTRQREHDTVPTETNDISLAAQSIRVGAKASCMSKPAGNAFFSSVDNTGKVTFQNGTPDKVRDQVPALQKPFVTSKPVKTTNLPTGVDGLSGVSEKLKK